jgi:hypothetical protein
MMPTIYTEPRSIDSLTPTAGGSIHILLASGQKWIRLRLRSLMQAVLNLFKKAALDTRGNLLLETTIAITVFAVVGGAVLSGISTSLKTGTLVEGQSIAEEIARNQMESVFNESYQEPPGTPYATMVPPAGYAVSVAADEYLIGEVDIEMVVVTVSRDSENLLVLETLRTRWD